MFTHYCFRGVIPGTVLLQCKEILINKITADNTPVYLFTKNKIPEQLVIIRISVIIIYTVYSGNSLE